MDVLCSNPETVEKLEQCVMNWHTHITIVIEEQQHKKPQVCDSLYILHFNQGRCGGVALAELLMVLPNIHICSCC